MNLIIKRMFQKMKIRRRLQKIGATIDTRYLVYLNNEEPMSFPSREDAFAYIKNYREETAISSLQIFRIETYSL